MISDNFLIKKDETERTLDKIERIAMCYEFKAKEIMQIRLLAEEIISMISPTFVLSDGRCRISTEHGKFTVIIDCDAGVNGLDESTKKLLIKMSRSEKNKGVFGMIGKVFEFLSSSESDYSAITGNRMFYSYGEGSSFTGYYWNPEFEYTLPKIETVAKSNEAPAYDLEISIIEGYADDIHVSLQKSKVGLRLEIAVVKNFRPEQTERFEILNTASR